MGVLWAAVLLSKSMVAAENELAEVNEHEVAEYRGRRRYYRFRCRSRKCRCSRARRQVRKYRRKFKRYSRLRRKYRRYRRSRRSRSKFRRARYKRYKRYRRLRKGYKYRPRFAKRRRRN